MTRTLEVLHGGLGYPEGPRWHAGRLWFSDFVTHEVSTVDLSGARTVVAVLDGQPSGIGFSPGGSPLVVSMIDKKLWRLDPGTGPVAVADLGAARGLCNDLAVDALGRSYVSSFGFDYYAGEQPRPTRMLRVDPDGSVHEVGEPVLFPNGLVVTPDGTALVVAETLGARLSAFTIADDGDLVDHRIFADLGGRSPDGICQDAEGAIWAGCPENQEFVRVLDGRVVDRIPTPGKAAVACALGGNDGRTFFGVTAVTTAADLAQGRSAGFIETAEVAVPAPG